MKAEADEVLASAVLSKFLQMNVFSAQRKKMCEVWFLLFVGRCCYLRLKSSTTKKIFVSSKLIVINRE